MEPTLEKLENVNELGSKTLEQLANERGLKTPEQLEKEWGMRTWSIRSLYSAIVIDVRAMYRGSYHAFSYGKAHPIMGSTKPATIGDTNIPKQGHAGLPKDWDMKVVAWRLRSSLNLSTEIMEFLHAGVARFEYNDRTIDEANAAELVQTARPVACHMRENLMYGVELTWGPLEIERVCKAIAKERPHDPTLKIWAYLDGTITARVA